MGAYFRFFERGVERQLKNDKSRGFAPPRQAPSDGHAEAGRADRRRAIPPLGLREYWYPALPARRVPRGKPLYWRRISKSIPLSANSAGPLCAAARGGVSGRRPMGSYVNWPSPCRPEGGIGAA